MNRYIPPLPQQQITYPASINKRHTKSTTSFNELLSDLKSNITISKHAAQRLKERNIFITEEKWTEISGKMAEAKSKGVSDALVVLDDVALVVNTNKNTVITALKHQEAKQRIFTNINGTILL